MRKTTILASLALAAVSGFSAACSGDAGTPTNVTSANTSATNVNATSSGHSDAAKTDEETPASVKAVFPDAQSFSKQHKDIPKDAVAEIEKDTGAKVPDTDHHSYLAFSTGGGARKQIGAATIVKAEGKDVVIVYDSKNGSPVIKEVRAEGVPAPFLSQFAGKGHDDKFVFGSTIKANSADEATAKAITSAIVVDVLTMQSLYGAAHSH
jgi:hypothetical protein